MTDDEKLKEIMKFSKDFGLDATTKVLEILNQYKDKEAKVTDCDCETHEELIDGTVVYYEKCR